jgi:exonuclease VII large subunit
LERGFALVTDENGQLVSSSKDFVPNKEYTLHLADGKVNVKV